MLRRISANKLVWSILAIVAGMPAAVSQTSVDRTAISAHTVADAMAAAGISANPDKVELLSGAISMRESANVRVVNVSSGTGGIVKVKLRCQDNHECLPFYVLVHSLDTLKVDATKARTVPVVAASAPQNVIRGGDHATLILETPDARMTFPVICLQSGARGQRIRVASPDRRQFYDAEVVASGIVKGSL